MVRYTLEFLLANAVAAWSGSEGQYDRVQDTRIAEVARRLDNIQLGVHRGEDAAQREKTAGSAGHLALQEKYYPRHRMHERPLQHGQDGSDAQAWLSWTVAIGAITCSGTSCMWHIKAAYGRAVVGERQQGPADQGPQDFHSNEGKQAVSGDAGRRHRRSAMQRGHMRQHQSLPCPTVPSRARYGDAGSDSGRSGCEGDSVQTYGGKERAAFASSQQGSSVRHRAPNPTQRKEGRPGSHLESGAQCGQLALPTPGREPSPGREDVAEVLAEGSAAPTDGTLCGMQSSSPLQGGELSRGAGASEGGYLERARHAEVASASHAVISRRILQFSMLAEVISGSDDAKLAELVLQLHTPVEKLRQWETHWRRISGQEQPGKASSRASAMSDCHVGDRQNLAALEAGDESVGPHGEWQHRQR